MPAAPVSRHVSRHLACAVVALAVQLYADRADARTYTADEQKVLDSLTPFERAQAGVESSLNFQSVNSKGGAAGLAQMLPSTIAGEGWGKLPDGCNSINCMQWSAKAASIGVQSGSDFLNTPSAQLTMLRQYENTQWRELQGVKLANGQPLTSLVGQTVNGITWTEENLRAATWNQGVGGMKYFIDSGGNYLKEDPRTYLAAFDKQSQSSGGGASLVPGDTTTLPPEVASQKPPGCSNDVEAMAASAKLNAYNRFSAMQANHIAPPAPVEDEMPCLDDMLQITIDLWYVEIGSVLTYLKDLISKQVCAFMKSQVDSLINTALKSATGGLLSGSSKGILLDTPGFYIPGTGIGIPPLQLAGANASASTVAGGGAGVGLNLNVQTRNPGYAAETVYRTSTTVASEVLGAISSTVKDATQQISNVPSSVAPILDGANSALSNAISQTGVLQQTGTTSSTTGSTSSSTSAGQTSTASPATAAQPAATTTAPATTTTPAAAPASSDLYR